MNALGLPSILKIRCYLEPRPGAEWMLGILDKYTWPQAGDYIRAADHTLGLSGELIAYVAEHGIVWEPAPPGSDTNTTAFLSSKSETGLFQGYSEKTQSGNRYTVLVDYTDYSSKILPSERTRADILRDYQTSVGMALFSRSGAGQPEGSRDTMNGIQCALEKISYRYGLPFRKMGFLLDYIKSVTGAHTPEAP
jgi:hypothetical protein